MKVYAVRDKLSGKWYGGAPAWRHDESDEIKRIYIKRGHAAGMVTSLTNDEVRNAEWRETRGVQRPTREFEVVEFELKEVAK